MDQVKMLAWKQHKARFCPSCGTIPDEWLDGNGRILASPPYEPFVVGCQGCRDIDEAQQGLNKDDVGLRVTLRVPALHPAQVKGESPD